MRWAVALCVALLGSVALADPQQLLTAAIRLYEEFQPEAAAPRLREFLGEAAASPAQKARAQLYLGLCLSTLGDEPAADAAFTEAFLLEPALEVLKETLAKIAQRAETARTLAKARLASRERAAAEEKARREAQARAESELPLPA